MTDGMSEIAELLASPWPIQDIIKKLVEAADILLICKNYDGHGYEEINAARDAAVEWLKSFPEELA